MSSFEAWTPRPRWRLHQRRLISLIGAVALLVVVNSASSARAADFTFLGAHTLQAGKVAPYFTVGLPDAEAGATFGLNSIADVTPRLRLQYGRATRLGGFGLALSASLRMKVAKARRWTFALVAEPELSLHMWGVDHPPTTTSGLPALAISPFAVGAVADREILPGVRLLAGLKVPLTFYMRPEWVVNVPIIAEVGAESEITSKVVLLTRVDSGFDFYGPGGLPSVQPYFRVRVGLGWIN